MHGRLDPLVNVNMAPDLHVRVTIAHKDTSREEVIKVYQTVQQFKATLQTWFGVPPQNMKLYYCDQVGRKIYWGLIILLITPFYFRTSSRWRAPRR